MIEAYKEYWKGYVDFTGRTSVGGYWWAVLAHFLAALLLSFLVRLLGDLSNNQHAVVSFLTTFWLICLLPSLAITVRRLRDAGRSWANLFWALLPIVGSIMLIVMLCKPTSSEVSYRAIDQTTVNGVPAYRTYTPQQAASPVNGGQAVQAYAPAAASTVPAAQPAQPSGAFRKLSLRSMQLYAGSGVCDVCNKPLSGQSAYIVPNPIFYSSPEWRAHFRQIHRSMLGLMGADADTNLDRHIDMMQRSDTSAGSAVCEDCIHMFAE